MTAKTLAAEALRGHRLALAQLITHIENGTPEGERALDELFPHTGQAHLIGVTGAPGTGKSTVVNALARYYRKPPDNAAARKVGIIAVDPSSPFTGGALLGDRIRMRDLAGDPGVFIRSMASRGSLGGLARATSGVVQALDAAGFDVILIETVGAGQSEVEIASLAHTTLVIEAPGLGDDIQAIKAGILEIADILVVNKADRQGVEATERALRASLQLGHPTRRANLHHGSDGYTVDKPPQAPADQADLWIPPVLRVTAAENEGIAALAQAIQDHASYLRQSGEWRRREQARLETELVWQVRESLVADWRKTVTPEVYQTIVMQLAARRLTPRQARE
ncbi:MAG TPA: methylmalonyl Co-A mutase-associated GTPase MeaB, partial [Anaerolineales bacterium]|nr:methylmalonyl Co-A mutase-associated GTPase MeaB [Anaerolineales bacterium]